MHLVTDLQPTEVIDGVSVFASGLKPWCATVAAFALQFKHEPILLLQEDFWLTHLIEEQLINQAHGILMNHSNVGAVRLFPCPGAGEGIGEYGIVGRDEPYRTSCQATIWRPDYLYAIAAKSAVCNRASDFELIGGPFASKFLPQEVMAFRRERYPWPIQYCCTAVRNGRWELEAKVLTELHGIDVDWSQRGFNVV